MEIVSGRVGRPHVTSQQFRQIIEGIVGDGSCILPSGENLEPELVSNNSLKIRSGIMCHHGNISSVKIGTYDEIELTNGTQGMKRIDLVVNRYTRNEEDNTEKNEWTVIMGTPAESNPTVPEYTKGNLQEGDLVDDCPAFEIHFDGINVTEVTKRLEIAQTNKDLSNKVAELNKNIACSPSVKRQETLISFQKNVKHKIEHTGQIQFAAAFSSTAGYCRIYVYNSSGEIVYREQLNPAPIPGNEVTTGQLQVYDGWEFSAESYNALVANMPKYTLIY
nr:MAG TPA: hypothetical protein [Caudoviricetes sp.]